MPQISTIELRAPDAVRRLGLVLPLAQRRFPFVLMDHGLRTYLSAIHVMQSCNES